MAGSPNAMCQEPNMADSQSHVSDTFANLDEIDVTDLLNIVSFDTMDSMDGNGNLSLAQTDSASMDEWIAPNNDPISSTVIPSTQGKESLLPLIPYSTQGHITPVSGNQDLLSSNLTVGRICSKQGNTKHFKGQNALNQFLKKTAQLLHMQHDLDIPWTLNNSENEMDLLCHKVKDLMLTHYPQTMALKDLDVICQQRNFNQQVLVSNISHIISVLNIVLSLLN